MVLRVQMVLKCKLRVPLVINLEISLICAIALLIASHNLDSTEMAS